MAHLLNTTQAAQILGLSRKTLEAWRWHGRGPAFVRIGRAVRYRYEALDAYIAANERSSTSPTGEVAR